MPHIVTTAISAAARRAARPPAPWPKRVSIHSAPVMTLERRTHLPMNARKNAPIIQPHIQWIHIERMPIKNSMDTIHMVPVMSKLETEPDMASHSQGIRLPPRK